MVVVLIVAIMTAIAVPMHSQYLRKSNRAAESQMLDIAGRLEQWRSKALSYKGFTPDVGYATDTSLTAATNSTLYLPNGSTALNYKYKVAILDGADRTKSLTTGNGQSWVMVAQPNTTNSTLNTASRLVLNSQGVRCLTDSVLTDAQFKANIIGTGSDAALCVNTSSSW